MPRNYPPVPDYSDPAARAEAMVWQALQELPEDAVVFAQARVQDKRRVTREADFLVAWPGVGVAILEVKGGLVWCDGVDWHSTDARGRDHDIRNPIHQADLAGYAFRDYAEHRAEEWPGWVPMAVLPDTRLPRWFSTPDSRPEQWIDSGALADLPARIEAAVYDDLASPVFDAGSVERLVTLLERDMRRPLSRDIAELGAAHADLITRDQYRILLSLRTNDRIVVTGGPGTGKTWLAMEHARQETIRGARAAVLCFNRALATSLRTVAAKWPDEHQPAFIGTLHHLALVWTGQSVPDPLPEGFWDRLPAALTQAAKDRPEDARFDVVVVDEGQDYRSDWWPAVVSALADPEGQLVVFRDEEQTLFDSGPLPFPSLAEVELTENVRNTPQIAAALTALPGSAGPCRGVDGPVPLLHASPRDSVLEVADQVVADLCASGQWQQGDIALLTTWSRHPEQKRLADELGLEGYSAALAGRSRLAVSTVMSYKGLERPVVVLAVNGFREPQRAADVLRVGMSRATHRLVVVADPHELRRVGGDGLMGTLAVAH